MNEELAVEITKWLGFTVLLSLLPVFFSAFFQDNFIREVIQGGELLLVSAVMCAAGIGEMSLTPKSVIRLHDGLAGVGATFVVVLGSLFYAKIRSLTPKRVDRWYGRIKWMTVAVFLLGVASSTACVVLTKSRLTGATP